MAMPQLQSPLSVTRFPRLRARLMHWRLYPLSMLARFFWLSLAVAVVFQFLSKLLGNGIIAGFGIVISVIAWIIAVPSGSWLVARWVKNGVLWRVRNRLIVTYLFIGAAPILLLLALALISGYFLAGQFAAFVVTNDLNSELMQVAMGNKSIAAHIQGEARDGHINLADIPELKSSTGPSDNQVIELFDRDTHPFSLATRKRLLPAGKEEGFERPVWLRSDFQGIVRSEGKLFFRAAKSFTVGDSHYTVISSEPLSSETLSKSVADIGQVQINGSTLIGSENSNGTTFNSSDLLQQSTVANAKPEDKQRNKAQPAEKAKQEARKQQEVISAGEMPSAVNRLDTTLPFASPLPVTEWDTGEHKNAVVTVLTRPSLLYGHLFSANALFGSNIRAALFTVATIFGFIEIFALFIGMRLTRSITHAVSELYNATQHIERGDLRHRIRLRSTDQLAALEGSFNTMSASLERLLLEQREKERLQSELAIAQEVQEQLFPRAWTSSRYLDLFGVCRPARTVSGDYYDFLPLGPARSGIAVGDISGKGISAALLMATIQSAVRSYEFGRESEPRLLVASSATANSSTSPLLPQPTNGHNPADAMWLLNRHLFHSTPPEKYATMFLAVYDGEARMLSYTNAGHLPPIIVRTNGSVERLNVSGTVIGLFEEMQWVLDSVALAPGDLFFAYSDGLTEPENEFGEFGEDRVVALLQQHRARPLEEIARLAISAVQEWIGEFEQPDDITVVLARPCV